MVLNFNACDSALYKKLVQTDADNQKILSCYSAYLNEAPDFVTPQKLQSLTDECGVSGDAAYRALFCAAVGIDESDREQRRFSGKYVAPSLLRRDAEAYRNDPYYKNISFPKAHSGNISTGFGEYKPCELFPCGDIVTLEDFTELPAVGYFTEEFRYPCIWENGTEWMTVKPNEIETMKRAINNAEGDAVVLGLGLGYCAYMFSLKENVKSVKVIEQNADIIDIFSRYILPQFPHAERLSIIQADAFEYAEKYIKPEHFVFADLWHDVSDGFDMYMRLRKTERRLCPTREWEYWIEPSFISRLRFLTLGQIFAPGGAELSEFSRIRRLLSEEYLRGLYIKTK